MTEVHAALYNPMIWESGFITLSLHKTEEGARKAIEEHQRQEYEEWLEDYKKDVDPPEKWDDFKAWNVKPMKIYD